MMNVISKFKKMTELFNAKVNRQISPEASFFLRLRLFVDYRSENIFHGTILNDYFEYEFYGKKQMARRKFACTGDCRKIYDICNPKPNRTITGDKAIFNKRFSDYLGRRWLSVKDSSYEEFCEFVNSVRMFFIKQEDGECGIGTGMVVNDGSLNLPDLYEKYRAASVMMEEVITQHKEMAEFNSTSVNTLRVLSFMDDNMEVHLMGCAFRMGRRGEVADNFRHNGICACVDVNTGIVYSTAIDANHNRYIVHPDSGKKIVGFEIPNWEDIVKVVIAASKELPELRYVGWDIAIRDDNTIVVVEGNSEPGLAILQAGDQIGKLELNKKLIKGL